MGRDITPASDLDMTCHFFHAAPGSITTTGDNGSETCWDYCKNNGNSEWPSYWTEAYCAGTLPAGCGCNNVSTPPSNCYPIQCICQQGQSTTSEPKTSDYGQEKS